MNMSYDEFIQSTPGKAAGVFFGDTDRYMKAMDWLYKVFGGWPGSRVVDSEYDAIKILIAASVCSAYSKSKESDSRFRGKFIKHFRLDNVGAPQSMADATFNFCDINVLDYIIMENYILYSFNTKVSKIDFSNITGDYPTGYLKLGTNPMGFFFDGGESLNERYKRYLEAAKGFSILESKTLYDAAKCLTIIDDASLCNVFDKVDIDSQKDMLYCASMIARRRFSYGVARYFGMHIYNKVAVDGYDYISDEFIEHTRWLVGLSEEEFAERIRTYY